MVISEKSKELLLKYFKDGNVMIEYGLNYLDGNTHCVNNINELNCILKNSENYSYISCYEMLPYMNINEFYSDLKKSGPYVREKFSHENYKIVSSFYTFKTDYDEEINHVKLGTNKFPLTFEELLKECVWMDGSYCGKYGRRILQLY